MTEPDLKSVAQARALHERSLLAPYGRKLRFPSTNLDEAKLLAEIAAILNTRNCAIALLRQYRDRVLDLWGGEGPSEQSLQKMKRNQREHEDSVAVDPDQPRDLEYEKVLQANAAWIALDMLLKATDQFLKEASPPNTTKASSSDATAGGGE